MSTEPNEALTSLAQKLLAANPNDIARQFARETRENPDDWWNPRVTTLYTCVIAAVSSGALEKLELTEPERQAIEAVAGQTRPMVNSVTGQPLAVSVELPVIGEQVFDAMWAMVMTARQGKVALTEIDVTGGLLGAVLGGQDVVRE